MPTGGKNEEGRPQGQASSEHCSARLVTKPHASLLRLLDVPAGVWTQKNFTEDMRLRVTSFCGAGAPPPMPFAISYSEVKPRLLFRPSSRRPRVLGQAAS